MRFDRQILMWTGGVVLLSAAFIVTVAMPQLKRMRELKVALSEERADSATNRMELQMMPRLQQEVATLTAQIADFDERIPEQEVLGSFLESLARSAEEHKLRPDAIEPGPPIRSAAVVALPIMFKVHGPFRDVWALVKDIEQMPRLTQIERFKTESTEDKSGIVSAELHIKIFSRVRNPV